jgi:predicted tellurium resistance membrane protein TerC
MSWLTDPSAWLALLTLTALELVLGIDNVIFISILAGRLPDEQRGKARTIGLAIAAVGRVLLLLSISFIMHLKEPLFVLFKHEISWRDVILIAGGLFLIYKSTTEIHQKLEGETDVKGKGAGATFGAVLLQIAILDVVFALDSIITAIGMVDDINVMIVAVILSVLLTMAVAKHVHGFVERHPTVKVLALSFLLMLGLVLVVDGFEVHVPKGYVYFAMGFSVLVEVLNMRLRKKSAEKPVALHEPFAGPPGPSAA